MPSGLTPLLARAIFNIHLLGRAQVSADAQSVRAMLHAPNAMLGSVVTDTNFEPLPFEAAIDYFRSKTVLTPEQFAALTDAARTKAFSVASGASNQVSSTIKDMLDQALSDGLTLKEFQNQAADVLDRAGVSERTPWYWETVYRTNLQTSYQVGRWKQQSDPAVVAELPYLRYVSARLPMISRPSHVEKHGLVYPIGDPFWAQWFPPNGFNCLCTTMSVSQSWLDDRGYKVSAGHSFLYPHPDTGFKFNAGAAAI